jgi:hypothetical protein
MKKENAPVMALMVSGNSMMKSQIGSMPKAPIVEKTSNNNKWVNWGEDNDLPVKILKELGRNEILFRANEFNKTLHLGSGVRYYIEKVVNGQLQVEMLQDPEIDDWMEENEAQILYKALVEDYENLGNIYPEVCLTKDRKRIARIFRKDAAWIRCERQGKSGEVEKVLINSDWTENFKTADTIEISVLDSRQPLYDLQNRNSGLNFIYRLRPIASNRFYYDQANAEVLMTSGTLAMQWDVKTSMRSLFKNQTTILWQIEVDEQYMISRYGRANWEKWKAQKPTEIKLKYDEVHKEVNDYLAGPDNAGKTLLTGCYHDQRGQKISGIIINSLDNKIKSGSWVPDLQQFATDIYAGMGVDASAAGGFYNMNNKMNSGSEKKSAFFNTQATLYSERLITLSPFYFAARYNGWIERLKSKGRLKFGVIDTNPEQGATSQTADQPTQ